MRFSNLKQDRGVAGLTVFLSLIVMLFVIGLLVMIFTLMGGGLIDSDTVKAGYSGTVTDTTLTVTDAGTTLTTCNTANQGSATGITSAYNESGDVLLGVGNYTLTTPCTITATSGSLYNNTVWNVTYGYTYAGESWTVMNDTMTGIGGATDWFSIFIVIGAMVVLILLTVMIITAIRGSGLIAGTGSQGVGNVGSA